MTARISTGKNAAKKLETLDDTCLTLRTLAEGCEDVSGLEQRIQALFSGPRILN